MTSKRPPIYITWANMKQRCLNKKRPDFKNYGGRGIEICKKWIKFSGFKEDMENTFCPGLTLDRIDNDKGYYKENCRWSDHTGQANNTRKNRRVILNGIEKTFSEWCRYLNLKRTTVRMRIDSYGWDKYRAFEINKY